MRLLYPTRFNSLILILLQLAFRILAIREELRETNARRLCLRRLLLLRLLLFLFLLALSCRQSLLAMSFVHELQFLPEHAPAAGIPFTVSSSSPSSSSSSPSTTTSGGTCCSFSFSSAMGPCVPGAIMVRSRQETCRRWLGGKLCHMQVIGDRIHHPPQPRRPTARDRLLRISCREEDQTASKRVMSDTFPPQPFLQQVYDLRSGDGSVYSGDEQSRDPPLLPQKQGMPYVTLTFAQSMDAKIAGHGGKQLALSGKESMVMTHW